MSDFQEVIRQRNRMCKKYYGHCASCPLNTFTTCANPKEDVLPAYEAAIMSWVKEHPESKYPTWIDWQQETFSSATTRICPKQFMSREEVDCVRTTCDECRRQPIPAEIAAKLGIKLKDTEE